MMLPLRVVMRGSASTGAVIIIIISIIVIIIIVVHARSSHMSRRLWAWKMLWRQCTIPPQALVINRKRHCCMMMIADSMQFSSIDIIVSEVVVRTAQKVGWD